jgi:hypothetical protein
MDEPIYPYRKSLDILTFDFESVGKKGISKKKIVYASLEEAPDLFNLSLFEVMPDGTLDVYFESKNQDLPRIMATIVSTLFEFFGQYPNKKVIFTGSTDERTRLYRIVIGKLYEQTKGQFLIEGIKQDGVFESFRLNQPYFAYVISTI